MTLVRTSTSSASDVIASGTSTVTSTFNAVTKGATAIDGLASAASSWATGFARRVQLAESARQAEESSQTAAKRMELAADSARRITAAQLDLKRALDETGFASTTDFVAECKSTNDEWQSLVKALTA